MGGSGGGQGDNLPATVQVATIRLSRLPVLSISSYSLRCRRVSFSPFWSDGLLESQCGPALFSFFWVLYCKSDRIVFFAGREIATVQSRPF